jgi:hypothetical protein
MADRQPFTFQHTHHDLHCSHYLSDITYEGEELRYGMPFHIEHIVAHHWSGGDVHDRRPWDQYNVGSQFLEEMVVYQGMCWRIAQEQHLDCYAIPSYYRDEAATLLKKAFDFIAWEYRVIAEDPHYIEDQGFIPARSAIPLKPPPSRWQRQHRHQAGLFHIETFADLVTLQKARLRDASSEITLFCMQPDRKPALLAFLNTPEVPQLAQFLAPDEFFIDLVIGIDMFYYDSLLIKTVGDSTQYIDALAQEYDQAIERFEAHVDSVRDMEAYLRLLSQLAQAHIA